MTSKSPVGGLVADAVASEGTGGAVAELAGVASAGGALVGAAAGGACCVVLILWGALPGWCAVRA